MINRTHRNRLLAVAVLCAMALPLGLLGQSKVGTTAAPFLGITVGPRAAAMGDAFAAVASDASALFYNPGAIARTGRSQFLFCHTKWLVDSRFNWVGLVFNFDGQNAIGISLTQLDYGEEEVTTTSMPEGTGEFWTAGDLALTLTYARNLSDRFGIGGSIKYVSQSIWNEKSSSVAMDVGLLFITPFNDMRLGMSISNFGGDMRMDGTDLYERVDLDPEHTGNNETIVARLKTESWPLPLFFRVGVAMDVVKMDKSRLTLAMDAFRPSDNTETVNVGAELGFQEMFFLRAGYKSLFREDSETGLTLGCGANVAMGQFMLAVDYTFADYGILQDVNFISLGFQF